MMMISGFAIAVIPALLLPWLLLPLRSPLLFAVLPVVPVAAVYARLIRRDALGPALGVAIAWAVALSVSTVAASATSPGEAMRGIWRAEPYRDEMLRWIATGVGLEGDPARFLPRLLAELALISALSAVSAGVAGLLMGAALLGYMNGYVGWVVSHAGADASPWSAALIAWPPWPMARVVSFVLASTAAAAWGSARIFHGGRSRGAAPRRFPRGLVLGSAAFLALDIALKWTLAPWWRGLLAALLGASAGIEAGGGG
jgi:hypothetical protein